MKGGSCYFRCLSPSSYGRYFEELEPGQSFRHWPGRTIAEFDDTLFSSLSMNQHPVHIDEHFAAGTQHGRRLVEGPIVISLVIGMSQADIGGRASQTLEYLDVRHVGPVFHGDTIYAESTVLEKRDAGRPDAGIVKFKLVGKKPDGTVVVEIERTVLIKRKSHWLGRA